jgi:type I restriction enzyme M protein
MYVKGEPVEGEIAVIKNEEVAAKDYAISPSFWVTQSDDKEYRDINDLVESANRLAEESAALWSTLEPRLTQLRRAL